MFKIGFISIKDNSGCTSLAIHTANYFGKEKDKKTVLIENRAKQEFVKANVNFETDGTFVMNNVRYIPSGVDFDYSNADIVIDVIGVVNFLSTFDNTYDLIYLCTDANEKNIPDILEFFHESGQAADIILQGASKSQIEAYKAANLKCITVGTKKDYVLPLAIADHIMLTMRLKGLIPPQYDKNAVYDALTFGDNLEEEKSGGIGSFLFGGGRKKKSDKPAERQANVIPKEAIVRDEPVDTQKGSIEKEYTPHVLIRDDIPPADMPTGYVNVPVPAPAKPNLEDHHNGNSSDRALAEEYSGKRQLQEDYSAEKELAREEKQRQKEEEKAESLRKKQEFVEKKSAEKAAEKARKEEESRLKKEAKELERARKENEKLHYKATHDTLCGVKNRTGLDEDKDGFKQYALIMFDVNNLKTTNDTLGHKYGDQLLKVIAKAISAEIADVYRFGGDEFIGIIRGATKRDEKKLIDSLSVIDKKLEKESEKDRKINYVVAYGYAYSSEGSFEKVKELADARMYADKEKKKSKNSPVKETTTKEPSPQGNSRQEPSAKGEPVATKTGSIFDKVRIKHETPATDKLRAPHLTVFVSGISHSVGTSYVAGSIASAMTDIYSQDVWLDLSENSEGPDNYMVKIVETDDDRFNAFRSPIYVTEKGVYSLLSDTDLGDMMRADLNIMVTTAGESDLREVAAFIKSNKERIGNWVFAFNHVQRSQEKTIKAAMKDYNYVIIPFHDNAEVDIELRKTYLELINAFLG